MKLYSSALCIGLLVVMWCKDSDKPPVVISDFCRQSAYAVAKIESLSTEQFKALPKAQKLANLSIIEKHDKDCRKRR